MKQIAAGVLMVGALVVAACGKDNESGSDSVEVDDPSGLTETYFDTFIPAHLKSYEVENALEAIDFKRHSKPSATGRCFFAKLQFDAVEGDFATMSGEPMDVTDCVSAADFGGLEGFSDTIRLKLSASVKIDGEPIDLVGTDFSDIGDLIDEAETFESEASQALVEVISGKADGDSVRLEYRSLTVNADGGPCRKSKAKGKPVVAEPCFNFKTDVALVNGNQVNANLRVRGNKQNLEAKSSTSTYWSEGGKEDIVINDWSGVVLYGGEEGGAEYLLTDDGSGEVKSDGYDDLAGNPIDITKFTVTSECSLYTTCTATLSFTANDDYGSSKYELAYASAEGDAAPATCTDENSTRKAPFYDELDVEDLNAETKYAFRMCIYNTKSKKYSPGKAATTTTPAKS